MRILITGAAGFIGSHLAERLAVQGHEVTGLDCLRDFYSIDLKLQNCRELEQRGVKMITPDLSTDDLTDAVARADVIYHLAAQPGLAPGLPTDTYVRDNVQATARLVDAAVKYGRLAAFINISTSSVYGLMATGNEETPPKPISFYGITKLAAEQIALTVGRDQGLPVAVLRLFSVYGPRERTDKFYHKLIDGILNGRPVPLFEGSENHTRSFSFVGDIVDGLVLTLERFAQCRGEIFNLGSDQPHTTGEAIRIIEKLAGRKAAFVRLPARPGDQQKTSACIDKARTVLGYRPATSLQEGLGRTMAWFKAWSARAKTSGRRKTAGGR